MILKGSPKLWGVPGSDWECEIEWTEGYDGSAHIVRRTLKGPHDILALPHWVMLAISEEEAETLGEDAQNLLKALVRELTDIS
jgi:hypothetical protein